ncbi:MAG: 30S ribosomal protein S4, partial [Gammaproteobacteria bacterium]
GDVITPTEKSKQNPVILETVQNPSLTLADYLDLDENKLEGIFKRTPEREDIALEVQENFVVEYYSRVA